MRIGLAAPLSGPDGVFGEQIRLGVEQAITDLNGAGGVDGRHVRAMPRDDGNDPAKAVEAAKALIATGVPVVIGDLSSAATVAASSVYAEAGVVVIAPAAQAPAVTDRGLPTVFRLGGRDDAQADTLARFLLARGFTRIAIVHDRTGSGKTLADALRATLNKAGITDIFYGSAEKGAVTGLVGRIKASGAQVVAFGGGATEAGLLLRALREGGSRATLVGGSALVSEDFAAAAGAAAEGALVTYPQDPKSRPAAADLLRRLRAKGQEPDALVFYAYAAVQVVAGAVSACHCLDSAGVASTMHSGLVFKTVLGPFGFTVKGDPTVSDGAIYAWHKGASGRMALDEQAKF